MQYMAEMQTSWDYRLVVLSVIIAIIGSYTALDFAGRMKSSEGTSRRLWFTGGAFMMGLAIWSMHFVGMMALIMPMPVTYNAVLMTLSILAAATGSGIAFAIMKRQTLSPIHMITGSIAMGLAISVMHYTGMASMQMAAAIQYTPGLFLLSIIIAITASAAALWIAFRKQPANPDIWFWQKIGSAVLMGCAVSGMHYTGMAAAHYYHTGQLVSGFSMVPTVGMFKLNNLLIAAATVFGSALLLLSAQTARENQKILQQKLQDSQARESGILASSLDAIITMDQEGKICEWNASAERIFGYRREDVIGQEMAALIIPNAHREGHRKGLARYLESDGKGFILNKLLELPVLRADGTEFICEMSITRISNSAPPMFTGILRDITERKQAEKALKAAGQELERLVAERTVQLETANKELRANEERMRFLIEAVKDYAIFGLDSDGIIQTWNQGVERIGGYKASEIIGRHISIFYREEDIQSGKVDRELQIAVKEGRCEDEGWRIRKDGSKYWANVIVTPIYDENGGLMGFSKIVRDLTKQKRAEEELRASEQRLREQSAQLEAANKELEAFSYSVSHDLRTPLRTIDGFSQTILQSYMDKLDEQGQHYLQRIREGSQRMGQLIDDMLHLARLTQGELDVQENVDLSAIAHDIADTLKQHEPNRNVTFDIETNVAAKGDKRLLQAALQNLLDNAWKFTARHETAHIEFGTIRTDLPPGNTNSQETCIYYVRDNGAGFNMNYADKLFGAFQRLHKTTEFSGSGIGLATVQRIIRRHGGLIWAEGEVEKGATFYFTLQPAVSLPEKVVISKS